MKPRTYQLLQQCVDDGVAQGICRAFKHTEKPTHDQIADAITSSVMHEVCTWFHFEEPAP